MPRMTPVHVRRGGVLVLLGALVLLVAACGSDSDGQASGQALWDQQSVQETHEGAGFFPQLLNSTRLAYGENRLQFAFFYPDQTMVEHAEVTARIYRLGEADSDPERADFVTDVDLTERTLDYEAGNHHHGALAPAGEPERYVSAAPPPHPETRHVSHDGDHATVFTANVEFDRMGWWGAELDVTVDGETYENLRVRFWIQERTPEPMLGEQIPASEQLIASDVDDIADIDSTIPPNPALHEVTVAEALTEGRPMVIAFVTPAFCQLRFCGPVMEEVVQPAWEQYGDEARFMHIEPFDIPRAREGVLEATGITVEWGILVEPIVFVTDAEGRVTAKLEGIVELEELEEALDAVIAS